MSIKKRFAVTFISNALNAVLSFLSGVFVARWLGVAEYGNLQFLTSGALAARNFTDLGTSSAFFTLISQKKRGWRILAGYSAWLAVQLFGFLALTLLLRHTSLFSKIWQRQPQSRVLLAIFSVFATDALWGMVVNIGESRRKTGTVQWAGLGASTAYALGIFLLWHAGRISAAGVLILNAVLYTLLSVCVFLSLNKTEKIFQEEESSRLGVRQVFFYYFDYCRPLLVILPFIFLHNFADTWLLQHFGGPSQQGYFGVSQQFAAGSLLAANSFVKVFWKETSEAAKSGDTERTRVLFQKACRLFYFAGSALSAILIPLTPEIVRLTLGRAYSGAVLPLAIMLLLPVHQGLGQITNTLFYATEKVKLYVRFAIPQLFFGLLVTYFLLADARAPIPGLGLGAVGLPIKLVILSVVTVSVNGWLISRAHGWGFQWKYQISCLGTLLATSTCVVYLVRGTCWLTGVHVPEVPFLAVCAVAYGLCLTRLVSLFPSVFGLTEGEYRDFRARLARWLGYAR